MRFAEMFSDCDRGAARGVLCVGIALAFAFPMVAGAKPLPPVDVGVTLTSPVLVGTPIVARVTAASASVSDEGRLLVELLSSDGGGLVAKVLWQGRLAEIGSTTATASLPAVKPGRYIVRATFEWVRSRDGQSLGVDAAVYLDVRPGVILQSTVSFRNILREEILLELSGLESSDLSAEQRKRRSQELKRRLELINTETSAETAEGAKSAAPDGGVKFDENGEPIRDVSRIPKPSIWKEDGGGK